MQVKKSRFFLMKLYYSVVFAVIEFGLITVTSSFGQRQEISTVVLMAAAQQLNENIKKISLFNKLNMRRSIPHQFFKMSAS